MCAVDAAAAADCGDEALALGADGVLIGRPWVWAVAARGERGLGDYLGVLRREIAVTMALMGVTRIDQIGSELLERRGAVG